MTLITFKDGKPVMRDGKVGTALGCCCQESGGGGCCVIDGQISDSQTTQAECEACQRVCTETTDPIDGVCPPGWEFFLGQCRREFEVQSCAECAGDCGVAEDNTGACGTWVPLCFVCCKPTEGSGYECSTLETTEAQCTEAGGIWSRAASCDGEPCANCGIATYTITGWFLPENEQDLQALAASAGWSVAFTYPAFPDGYCPPDNPCPGPFTDECGQTFTTATFTSTEEICTYCGTASTPQRGYGVGGNYWPSVFGGTPCDELVIHEIPDGDYVIPLICGNNPLP